MISNSGLDVDMYFYKWNDKEFANKFNNGSNTMHIKLGYNKWHLMREVSATTTFNEVTFRSGKDWQLSETRPRPGELNMKDMARVCHSPNERH